MRFLPVAWLIYFPSYLNYLLTTLGLQTILPKLLESKFHLEFANYFPQLFCLLHLKLVLDEVNKPEGDPPIVGRSQCIQKRHCSWEGVLVFRLLCRFEWHLKFLVRAVFKRLFYRGLPGYHPWHLDGEGFLHKVCLKWDLLPDLIYFGTLVVTWLQFLSRCLTVKFLNYRFKLVNNSVWLFLGEKNWLLILTRPWELTAMLWGECGSLEFWGRARSLLIISLHRKSFLVMLR